MEQKISDVAHGFWPDGVMVGEVVYPAGGTLGPRIQTNIQLVMIHSGLAAVWIDGVMRCASANTVFVLFPDHKENFAFSKTDDTWHTWLHIAPHNIDEAIYKRLKQLEWPLPLSPSMQQLIREALTIQHASFPTATEMLKALAAQMIWRYIGEGELRQTQATQRSHPAVEQAQQFIHAHLSEPITLDDIAHVVAMSPAHLIRLFQAQLHTPPMAYLWQLRVKRGIELLEQTGLTVGTIAERCGFQSRFHFSRRIHAAVGYTPLEVRRRSWQRPIAEG